MSDPKLEHLEDVIRSIIFSADIVAMRDFITEAARTRAVVKRAIIAGIDNGMLTINDPDEWEEWMALDKPEWDDI